MGHNDHLDSIWLLTRGLQEPKQVPSACIDVDLCFAGKKELHSHDSVPTFNDARLDAGCITPQAQADARFSQMSFKIMSGQNPPSHFKMATCFMLAHVAIAALDTSAGKLQTIDLQQGTVHRCTLPGFVKCIDCTATSISTNHCLLFGGTPTQNQQTHFMPCQSVHFSDLETAKGVSWESVNAPDNPLSAPTVARLDHDHFLVIGGTLPDQTCSSDAYIVEMKIEEKVLQWNLLEVRAPGCKALCD